MDYEERRSAKRYRLQFPLRVRWSGAREAITKTVDISSRGVYFFLSEALPRETPIDFVMTLFPELAESKRVQLECRGHVQRTDVLAKCRVGIAASIDSYEFAGH